LLVHPVCSFHSSQPVPKVLIQYSQSQTVNDRKFAVDIYNHRQIQ
jgi:hypothetical protein